MGQKFHEEALRRALGGELESLRLRELGDASPFFSRLMTAYPVTGSKIDWHQVPGSIEDKEQDVAAQVKRYSEFFEHVVQTFGLSGDVVYVGDSATDSALGGALDEMRRVLAVLLSVPQHHYLIGADFSWCACFTMEGDMGFGFSPSSRRAE